MGAPACWQTLHSRRLWHGLASPRCPAAHPATPPALGQRDGGTQRRPRPAERRRHGNAAGSGASSAAQSRQNLQLLRVGPRGGGEPPRSGAGSSPEKSPARESPRRPSFLRDLCIPVPSCTTQDPFPQARPLPDVGAAQGESQQVERSAAHAQADEADHRDELREDRKNFLSGTAPPDRLLQAFLFGQPPPHPIPGLAFPPFGERGPAASHHMSCHGLPQPIANLLEVVSRDTATYCRDGLRALQRNTRSFGGTWQ